MSDPVPLVRVVRGAPSDAEVAAVVAYLVSASGPPARRPRGGPPTWGAPVTLVRAGDRAHLAVGRHLGWGSPAATVRA